MYDVPSSRMKSVGLQNKKGQKESDMKKMGPYFHDVVAIILGPSLWPWTHLKNITWIDLTQKFNVWGIDIRAWNILEDLMQVRFFSEQNTQTTIKKSHSTSSSGGCLFVIIVHYGPKYIRRITELNRQLQLLRSSNNQTELRRGEGGGITNCRLKSRPFIHWDYFCLKTSFVKVVVTVLEGTNL